MKPTKTRLHTTGLTLAAGALALAGTMASADQVILDDLIVDGSACVGQDCVNGELFGFDTLRLKENNLRLHFDDTSNSSSFPDNDWRLVANDSSNGGAEYLAIEDFSAGRQVFRVTAGARTNSIFVSSSGNVGFGTATPSVTLHARAGNTPTLRLEQDGSSGFTPQTWDLAGNEAGFFVRDATNGSTLPLRIRPSAPSSAIDVAADGDVGIGTGSPTAATQLDVVGNELTVALFRGNGTKVVDLKSDDGGAVQYRLISTGAANSKRIVASQAGATPDSQIIFNSDEIKLAGANDNTNLFATFNSTGLAVEGELTTTGGGACTSTPCDAVFDPEVYTVPSIEEHAALMWENKHLPAVGPTGPGQPINITDKMTRMLNELEHAHIFIQRLNDQLKEQRSEIATLKSQIAEM